MKYVGGGLGMYGQGIVIPIELVMRPMRASIRYVETSLSNTSHPGPFASDLLDLNCVPSIDSSSDDMPELGSITSNDSTIELQEPHPTPFVQQASNSSPSTF